MQRTYFRARSEAAVLRKTNQTSDPGILTSDLHRQWSPCTVYTHGQKNPTRANKTRLASRSKQNGRNTRLLLFSPKLRCPAQSPHHFFPKSRYQRDRQTKGRGQRVNEWAQIREFCPNGQLIRTQLSRSRQV